MEEYPEDGKGNNQYIVHETYIKYLPKILTEGLSRMERNHVHLCKQIGETWIRRKKRANIAIYVDVQETRRDGLKFFSAPNDGIMCSGDEMGCIPIKYFKEKKNIHTGEQITFKAPIPVDHEQDKSLSLLAQNFTAIDENNDKQYKYTNMLKKKPKWQF